MPAFPAALGSRSGFFCAVVVVALCIPDIDFLLRRLSDDAALAHGGATHSLCAGLFWGALFTLVCRWFYGAGLPLVPVFLIGLGCAWSHALMDVATWGGGVMLMWPFSVERYTTVPLFYGARHSQPTAWGLHLITLTTELLFAALVWLLARGVTRKTRRTGK